MREIAKCPNAGELSAALEIVRNFKMHFYQLLFSRKLTEPGDRGKPFKVDYETPNPNYNFDRGILQITFTQKPEFYFTVSLKENQPSEVLDTQVLQKCEIIQAAWREGREKFDRRACCALAVASPCVCALRTECILHGAICRGTHD